MWLNIVNKATFFATAKINIISDMTKQPFIFTPIFTPMGRRENVKGGRLGVSRPPGGIGMWVGYLQRTFATDVPRRTM